MRLWVNDSEKLMIAVCAECEATWKDVTTFLESPLETNSFYEVNWHHLQPNWREGRRADIEGTPIFALVKGYWN